MNSTESTHESEFDTPVLVIGFNRPHLLRQLIDRLRSVRPSQMFVAIDGPRFSQPRDHDLVSACQQMVEEIDWPCRLSTQFQGTNLGCGRGVTTAIDWLFEQVDEGIIVEDDVLPDPTFFPFCSTLLERYRNDHRVFAVSGSNLVPPTAQSTPSAPYRFSRVPHILGWATWKRTWQQHRLELGDWRADLDVRTLWEATGKSVTGTLYWGGIFHMLSRGLVDTWDYQLTHASMRVGGLTATSNINLTDNIGIGPDATHMQFLDFPAQPVSKASFPLDDVPVTWDETADAWTRTHHYQTAVKARQALRIEHPGFQQFVQDVRSLDREQRRSSS